MKRQKYQRGVLFGRFEESQHKTKHRLADKLLDGFEYE
jgi:hypothetical protein